MNKDVLSLERDVSEPLYIRLYEHYRERIISGAVPSGAKLPSIRRCCKELELSKTTVEAAYLQLAAEGYVISKPGSGFYAADLSGYDKPSREREEGAGTAAKFSR